MIKRILWLAPAATLIAAFAITAPPAQALPHGATCELTGGATFTPGLTAKPNKAVSYVFTGSLTGCHGGTVSKAPPNLGTTSGSINAHSTGTKTGLTCEGGVSTASGSGSTGTGTFSFNITAVGAGAIVLVEGAVTGSSDPNIHAGDKAAAALVFQTTTPQACAQGGLSSATFTGQTGTGMVK